MDCSVQLTGSPGELAEIFAELDRRSRPISNGCAMTVEAPKRFLKLDDQGERLPDAADTWSAVFDRKTGLIWTAENVGSDKLKWDAAKMRASSLTLLGQTDWRLPEVHELFSLVDVTRRDPAIDPAYFRGTKSDWYWSASPCAGYSGGAWFVGFSSGFCSWGSVYDSGFVRAVRSARAGQQFAFGL